MNKFYTDQIKFNYVGWWKEITSIGKEKEASEHSREFDNYQEMLALSKQ